MIAQRLLGEDRAAGAIAIDAAQIKGVLPLPLSALKATLPVFKNPANKHRAVSLTAEQFRFAFGNAIPEEESDELFEKWAIPAPGKPLFEAAAANFNPHSPAKVATDNQGRGPLLLIMGGKDHTVPEAVTKVDPQAVPPQRGDHRHPRVPRPRPLADDRPRLARGRRRLPVVARRVRACDGWTSTSAGRSAVVTGASKGIGLAITRALADEGVSVVAGALKGSDELDELAASADVRSVRVDLTTSDGPGELVAAAATELGGIDILVNNVGAVRPRLEGFLALTDEDWEWALTINFLAAVRTMRAAIPHMAGRPGASIVTISSVNAFLPDPGVIDYSAAKGALTNLCKSLSKELGPGHPGQHDQPRTGAHRSLARQRRSRRDGRRSHAAPTPGDVVRRQEAEAATGRFTYPNEIADLVLFLASDRSANTTGSDFVIDGGLITTL